MQENNSDALVGTVVDHRYAIHSRIAPGGMSTVYLATDLRLDRDVALKVLHPHLAHDRNFLDRLGREAKAAARLSHPHVVGVLDQGNDGSTAYLVMEYIEGHTLRDVLNEKGALTTRLTLALMSPVIAGLAAAHEAGLIHRDVKPENVLMAKDGRIKIGDFGLSRAVTTSTNTGVLLGTVAYISPELVMNRPSDERSDVYSAGIMLYEMLTGRQPYQGDTAIQVAYQHVHGTVPPPSELVPGLAKDVDELVQWCTAGDPENRPVNGLALFEELSHIRTRLTDAELDTKPATETGVPLLSGSAGEQDLPPAPSRQPGTEFRQPTEVIRSVSNPTSIFPAAALTDRSHTHLPRRYPTAQLDPEPEQQSWPGPAASQPGKRARKRAAREEIRAQSKAAATPVRNLRDGSPRRRGFLWVVVLILAMVLATGAGWYFGMGPGSPGTIPRLTNMSEEAAGQELTEAGFQYSTTLAFDDAVAAGYVISTEPPGGTEIRRYERISLVISKGPQLFPLAGFTGASLEEVKLMLNQAGMALGPIAEVFSETAPAGTVLSQDPAPATAVPRGTPVALTVSKGQEPLPVPDVTGMDREDAEDAIEAAGLTPDVVAEVNDRNVPEDHVVAQAPADGTLFRGGTVELTVSEGPKMVKVPDYVGKQAGVAQKELQELGFTVRINEVLGGLFGTVRAQEPDAKELPEGSVITLTVV